MSQMEAQGAQVPTWTLGWRLQRSLSWAGITVQQMAHELHVSRGTISRWCSDRNRPRYAEVDAWARITGVPLEWLAGDDYTPRSDPQRSHYGSEGPGYTPIHNEVTALAKPIGSSDEELRARLSSGIPVSSVLSTGQVVNS